MSIYEGTEVEQSYAAGITSGYNAGEIDRKDYPSAVSDVLAAFMVNAATAIHRESRAYYLGYLRGYREAVR
jgi:hypothetical protein